MLKSFAVRKLADALADYIEGVTPESVTASLGRDVGELDLCARLSPAPLQKLGLELEDSELSVRVRIPWRNLDAEPTELSVNSLRLVVRMQPRRELSLGERRASKEAAVRRLESAAASSKAAGAGASGVSAGRIARASHAALRQIRVKAGRIEGRVHRECPGLEPLCFQMDGARLESVGSDWKSPPQADQSDLYKVLGISGLSVNIGDRVGGESMVGPLTWDARLLHKPKRGLVHLSVEMPQQAVSAGVRVDPSVARYARGCLLWQLQGGAKDVSRLPEDAGRRYAVLFSQQLNGEEVDSDEIQQIEDAAPPAWIAGWREWCRAQQAQQAQRERAQSAQAQKPADGARRRYRWWWSSDTSGADEAAAGAAGSDEAAAGAGSLGTGGSVLAMLDAQDSAGFLPEVAPPTHVVLQMLIPRLEGRCQGLEVDADGATCCIEVKARASNAWEVSAQDQLWQISAFVALRSVSARFDGSTLVSLCEVPQQTLAKGEVAAISMEFSAAQREPSAAEASQDVPAAGRKAPWDLALTLRGEPVRVHLAPWTIRGTLMTVVEVANAWQQEGKRAGIGAATVFRGAAEDLEGTPEPGGSYAPPSPSHAGGEGSGEDAWAAAVEHADTEASTIKVDLELEAPIVYLELPKGGYSLRAHLGGLRVHTHDGSTTASLRSVEGHSLPAAAPSALATFALACELRENSVFLSRGESERTLYGASTLMVYFKRGVGDRLEAHVGASSLKLALGPDFAQALGQLPVAFDFASSPLMSALADAVPAPSSESRSQEALSTAQASQGKPGSRARSPVEFGLVVRSLEVMWLSEVGTRSAGRSSVVAVVDQVVASAERELGEDRVKFRSSVTRLALEAGGEEVLASAGQLTCESLSEASSLQVTIGAPPVRARLAVQPLAEAMAAVYSIGHHFAEGAACVQEQLPASQGSDGGLSKRLWNRYVTERAHRIEKDVADRFGLGSASSEGGAVTVNLNCAEVSALVEGDGKSLVEPIHAALVDARGTIRLLTSKKIEAQVTLASMQLSLNRRCILAPRRPDSQLLRMRVQREPAPAHQAFMDISWAQVALVYRQRDFDGLMATLRQVVAAAVAKAKHGHANSPTSPRVLVRSTSASSPGSPSPLTRRQGTDRHGIAKTSFRYKLSIDAPLVFLPSETTRRLQPGQDRGPPWRSLVSDGKGHTYVPAPEEAFAVINFGHLDAHGGEQPGLVQLHLREAQAFCSEGDASDARWPTVIYPLGLSVEALRTEGHFKITVKSPLDESKAAVPRLSFTRAQATALADIIFLNISYRAAAQQMCLLDDSVDNETWLSMDFVRGMASTAGSFEMTISWRGPLRADVSFTEDAPLASLELLDGTIGMHSGEQGFFLDIRCSGVVTDTRMNARNETKLALVCAPCAGHPQGHSLHIQNFIPADPAQDAKLSVNVTQPVLWVFPQLITDLLTWGMSLYQHSAQAKAALAGGNSTGSASPAASTASRAQSMDFTLENAAVRVAASWAASEGAEFLELVAGAKIGLHSTPGNLRIENIDVVDGCWQRGILGVRQQPPAWCTKFEGRIRGGFNRGPDTHDGQRISSLEFETLETAACCMQLSVMDLATISTAVMLISEFEADSAEPAGEIRMRDPLALVQKKSFNFSASVEVRNLQLQLLDESAGGARPALEVNLNCPLATIASSSSRGDIPQANFFCQNACVAAKYYNERIGKWESVLAASDWFVKYKSRPGQRPCEGHADLVLQASQPLDVTITPPFVHLAYSLAADASDAAAAATANAALQRGTAGGQGSLVASLGAGKRPRWQNQRKRMLLGVNLSNASFVLRRSDTGAQANFAPGSQMVGLDALLADISSTQPLPDMALMLPGGGVQKVRLDYENDVVWKTPDPSVGDILVRVLMLRPPQRILFVSSTVLVANRTGMDIDVLFPEADVRPLLGVPSLPPFPCLAAGLLDAFGSQWAPSGGDGGEVDETAAPPQHAEAKAFAGHDECFGYTVPAGCICSAPVAALVQTGAVLMQLRPALGCGAYRFSPRHHSMELRGGDYIRCRPNSGSSSLPDHFFYVEASGERGMWCRLSVEPPFQVANASPCNVYVNFSTIKNVIEEDEAQDQCDAGVTVVVCDGYGGTRSILPDSQEDIYPVKVDEDGWFYWHANGGRERHRPRARRFELLKVSRQGRRIKWKFCRVEATMVPGQRLCLRPTQETPVYDLEPRGALFAVALKDEHTRKHSSWSTRKPVVVPPSSAEEEDLAVDCVGGMRIGLGALRQEGRRMVFFSRLWFANSTGLNAQLCNSSGRPVPTFGDVGLPAIDAEGEAEVFLSLLTGGVVEVPMPPLGGSARVELSPIMDVVVKAEALAVRATSGVFCTLLTATPAIMAFCQVPDCQVGFRQEGCSEDDVSWLVAGESAPVYWTRHDRRRRIEVTVRSSDPSLHRRGGYMFSAPFDVSERGVGAFPLVLMQSASIRRLICIQVDQSGSMSTVTASGEECCHRIANRHPCLMVDAYFENEEFIDAPSHFIVPHGECQAIARSSSMWQANSKLKLVLGDIQTGEAINISVNLQQSSIIPVHDPASKAVPALVRVDLRRRVALLTVSPVVVAGPVHESIWRVKLEVEVPRVSISVVGERPRTKMFGCVLGGFKMNQEQRASSQRITKMEIGSICVHQHYPKPEVLIASVGQPCFCLAMVRDDIAARDVKLSGVSLDLWDLEVTFQENVLKEAQRLAKDLAPQRLGVELDAARSRAGVPYHLHCTTPPEASRKYVLRNVRVGEAKVAVWCSLSTSSFPSLVGVVMQLSSWSSTLEIQGARVKLPEQGFFQGGQAFEGSLGSLASTLWDRYKPCLKASWKSLLNNSNAVLGGVFSRSHWNPRKQTVTSVQKHEKESRRSGSAQLEMLSPLTGLNQSAAASFQEVGEFATNMRQGVEAGINETFSTVNDVFGGLLRGTRSEPRR